MLLLPAASSLLLAWCAVAQEAAAPPFHLELPAGYRAFEDQPEYPGWWIARHEGGRAAFTVRHQLLETAGADAARFAEQRRREYWTPSLREVSATVSPWEGPLGGAPAYGSVVRARLGGEDRVILERFQVHLDHLIALTWEGAAGDQPAAEEALAGFLPPPTWRPAPLELDSGRGGGPAPLPSPGHFQIVFDAATEEMARQVWVTVTFQAAPWLAGRGSLRWRVPGEPEPVELELDQGACRLEYPLVHEADPHRAHDVGLVIDRFSIATSQVSSWLAAPLLAELEREPGRGVEPPSWQIEARVPAHVSALSARPAEAEEVDRESGARVVRFPVVEAGQGWPFVLMGQFSAEEIAGLEFHHRSGSKPRDTDGPVRFLARARAALAERLPASAGAAWEVTSFPGTGDRVFPGMLVLDEERGWLRQAVDQQWELPGGTRRRGLAELVVSRAFGLQLRGDGSAAPFLEASLTAFYAQRLLADLGFEEEAAALAARWRSHDEAAGALPAPLSRMPRADLFGAQRLLGRGPLVWAAIEARATREGLDAVLDGFLRRGGSWTTEELRSALEERTGDSWEPFFRRHVYGREAVPATD
jgi:hypothetical protein